jgi:predicted dehydrogenase
MEIVVIGSPSGLHGEQGVLAAERGLHVLVEKPLEITLARADRLIHAADRAGVKLAVCFQDRLQPDVIRMKGLIESGAIGAPILASARVKWYRPPEYYSRSTWRGTWALDGGGAVMNQGIHTIDLLLWLLGPIVEVDARTATQMHAIEVEDSAVARLHFASGVVATYEATTAAYPGYPRTVEITGSAGTLVLSDDRLVAVDTRDASVPAPERQHPAPDVLSASNSPIVADVSKHRRLIEDFICAVRERKEPACSGREGRRSVEVVEAIYTSSRERRAVSIPRS